MVYLWEIIPFYGRKIQVSELLYFAQTSYFSGFIFLSGKALKLDEHSQL